MSVPAWLRRFNVLGLVAVLLLTGCGREVTRPPSPGRGSPPNAIIVSPTPIATFTHVLRSPVTIRWTGEDPDGDIQEYRYRLFESTNPDFPYTHDFISFLNENLDLVLGFYAPDFDGWGRRPVRRDSDPSVTYPTLAPNEMYAFVVVAVDSRGEHDSHLSRNRNVLKFAFLPPSSAPDVTFFGPFGEVTVGGDDRSGSVQVAAGQAVTIHWSATPRPGGVIRGYRWTIDNNMTPTYEPSLDDTATTIPPPSSGDLVRLDVEVHYDQGSDRWRTLRSLVVLFTGSPPVAFGRASR